MSDGGPVVGGEHDQRLALTPRECLAMQLLRRDGWSRGELCMVFEITDGAIDPHLNGECCHDYSRIDPSEVAHGDG